MKVKKSVKKRLKRSGKDRSSKKRKFTCTIDGCHKKLTSKANLKVHLEKPHGFSAEVSRLPKIHACRKCGKMFRQKFDLKIHFAVHGGEKPFKCKRCQASFALKGRLEKHMESHREHVCKEANCNFVADSWNELLNHSTAEHQKVFKCEVCKASFETSTRLQAHIVMHFSNKFGCNYELCTKNYQTSSNLQTHVDALHLKIIHRCDYEDCGSEYKYRGSLLRHQKMHSVPSMKAKAIANYGRSRCMASVLSEFDVSKAQNYKLLRDETLD
ncbi:transcription factor IIIA-like protein [Leptotrombidium deliense]|uniref:Transcription factor IIIA-like protein n=1 Tax=Leptotrombidium deliense TaxID=299467 RepID=A0A443SHF9_9ACAR|nr:transcription factor IIIA-like protein [Leptotrombidium deliense]